MKSSTVIAMALTALCLIGAKVSSAQQHAQFYAYVSNVNVGDDHEAYLAINVPGNFSGMHGCTAQSLVRSKYSLSDPRTKAWLEMALESFRLKKQVHVRTSGCSAINSTLTVPVLVNLSLQQP